MLRRISNVAQHHTEVERHWFMGDDLDLFLWTNPAGDIIRFQFSYHQATDEKSLIWDKERGVMHARVDDGVSPGKHPASPILGEELPIKADELLVLLSTQRGDLPESFYDSVKLRFETLAMDHSA